MIDQLSDAGLPTKACCRTLGVSAPGYYKYKHRPMAPTQMRSVWLTALIREVHTASRGTYSSRRVHPELTLGMGVHVSERLVAVLMSMNRIAGLPSVGKVKRLRSVVSALDMVKRKFHRPHPMNYGLLTSLSTQHMKARSTAALRLMHSVARIIGWSIDTVQNSNLVVSALDIAIKNRNPSPGGVVHAGHGVQFTSWAFTNRIRQAGLMLSFGSVGHGLDNAMMESFWSSMQIELLNRKRWKTRIELANAIFEYIEIFHNRQRRHSSLAYCTPIEFELSYENSSIPA